MKDLLRQNSSLTQEMEDILNEQVKKEAVSSAKYLSMASWCERYGYENSAKFLFTQAEDERNHMLRIFHFICDMGGTAVSPETRDVHLEFDNFKEVFETALDQEINNTQSINKMVDTCIKNKDYITHKFLEWFLDEQKEEEYIFRRALELFDIIGEEGTGKFMIDQQIAKIQYTGDQ